MLTDVDLECEVASHGLNPGAVASYAYVPRVLVLFQVSPLQFFWWPWTLLATVITYCCMRRRGKSSGKAQVPSSEEQKPVLVYSDREAESRPVVMLEMKENIAYCHVEH